MFGERDDNIGPRVTMEQLQNEIDNLEILGPVGISPKLFDAWLCDNSAYIVMERVNGITLEDYYSQKKLVSTELANMIRDTILTMHSMGVIHGDLHGENIIISHRNDNIQVKLIDFGQSYMVGNEPWYDKYRENFYTWDLRFLRDYKIDNGNYLSEWIKNQMHH